VRSFRHGTTATSLLVLILIFLVLVALIVVFFQQILVGLAAPARQANQVLYAVLVLFPLALLAIIVYQLVRLARERAARRPGARLKGRLLLFFGFVALLSAVPQALLSISFIGSTISYWLRAGIGESLAAGLDLSLTYYHGLVENLARFNSSPLVPTILQDLGRNPERLWKNVQTANSQVHFIQVFDTDGAEVLFRGQREGRLRVSPTAPGYLPKEDRSEVSLLRHAALHSLAGRTYTLQQVLKHDFFAVTARYAGPDGEPVCLKHYHTEPWLGCPLEWAGRLMADREVRHYRRLADLGSVPQLVGRVGKSSFAHAWVEGNDLLDRKDRLPDDFFDRLEALVRAIHARGMAYVDMNKPDNVLVGADGRPVLIDFQISWAPRPSRWRLAGLERR
jgi:hypothetical protein